MLRAGFSKAAQILPQALAAGGSLGRLLQTGAGLPPPREVASFPSGNPEASDNSKELTKEED